MRLKKAMLDLIERCGDIEVRFRYVMNKRQVKQFHLMASQVVELITQRKLLNRELVKGQHYQMKQYYFIWINEPKMVEKYVRDIWEAL